jgi:uncharacterized membrane protein YphA (DoxX/SURF4 family)
MILVRLWQRYVAFWNEREGPESLALLRITFAAALIGNLLEQLFAGMVLGLYALPEHGGIFPLELSSVPLDLFSRGWLTPTPAVVWMLFWGQFLAAILLLVGLQTRLAAFVCFVLQVTLNQRMRIFVFGGDNVLRIFLFLMVLAPAGAAWSLDARWRRKGSPEVPAWPRRLVIFQLTVVYVATGIMKMGPSWTFLDGWSAVYLSLNLPGISRWPGDWAASAWIYPLTQIGTFVSGWWETTFFLVPLNMRLRRRVAEGKKFGPIRRLLARWDLRVPYILVGLVMHVSLTVLLDLGLFSVVMLSLYPCLLHPHESRRILNWFARLWERVFRRFPSRRPV